MTLDMENRIFEDLKKSFDVFEACYKEVYKIQTKEIFGAVLGMMIDQWFADHDYSVDEAHYLLEGLADTHDAVNNELGEMQKSNMRG